MSRAKTMLDALEGSSSGSDSDDDSKEATAVTAAQEQEQDDDAQQPEAKRAKKSITLDDLEAVGFKAGPSILAVKPPKEEVANDWRWSDGKDARADAEEETYEDRERTRAAATTAAEEGAFYAVKAMEHAARARDEAKAERERLAAEKKLTWNQKEKRKRDAGQASRAKNYVEEEKRLARSHGVFSGFD